MARATFSIIEVLRNTAADLTVRSDYQWGHMGSCNCGFLAQQITCLQKSDIHGYAMQRTGDWSEQLHDYCPTSGYAMDALISEMIAFGFDTEDLKHLERLSDSRILVLLPPERKHLTHNVKADVVLYLTLWADLLESNLIGDVKLEALLNLRVEA